MTGLRVDVREGCHEDGRSDSTQHLHQEDAHRRDCFQGYAYSIGKS